MDIVIPDNIRLLIFDCEGTLAHTKPLLIQASFITFQKLGYPQTIEFLEETWSLTIKKAIEELNRSGKTDIDIEQFNDMRAQTFEELLPSINAIAASLKLISAFKDRLPMAIASNGNSQIVLKILKAIGLENIFDYIICSYDGFEPKPSPAMLIEAASRANVDIENCILIEDAKNGFEAADQAGMRWIDIKRYYSKTTV